MGSERTKRNNKYNVKAYDRIALNLYKGEREVLKKYADLKGMSINKYINLLIEQNCEPIREMRERRVLR